MAKLVVLKLGEGSFEQGFPVTLQIGDDGDRPAVEMTRKLPPAPEIPQFYKNWQTSYLRLGLRSRLTAKVGQVTNVSKIESCCDAAQQLSDRLNLWLNSESFRAIREKLLEQLSPTDTIRVIIQTEDTCLRRLPWHLWDLGDRYPQAEIALSTPDFGRVAETTPPAPKVRILAILGNSTGIDTHADRLLLEQVPNAEITFLVEPQRQELSEQLWKGWDIFFFAGHSSSQVHSQPSQGNAETGQVYLNQTDSLTIEQLKYALKKAVERGLKIAIFNSCDGLGLARDLAELRIPQIIVMREPVPDRVAQEFLKSFLEAFARGENFYISVREARERLHGLEDQFPCASWLPIICQNLAEMPPTWQQLHGQVKRNYNPDKASLPLPILSRRRRLGISLLTSAIATVLVVGVRQLGILQPLELQAFDRFMQWRPEEKPDPRLLVVKVTEADLHLPQQQHRQGSLADLALTQLVEKLEQYQPRAIGLDIYRDYPVNPKYADLAARLRQNQHFIAVCKVGLPEVNDPGIKPPPEIAIERQGFSNFVPDSDGVVRRQLLVMSPNPTSLCTTPYAFSVQLAFRYLAAQGILPQYTPEGFLQIGRVVFQPLSTQTGGYQKIDAWGHQVLLNYRSHRSPQNIAAQVTLKDVLTGEIDPAAVKDRVVLIGTTATSFNDYWLTPYSNGQSFEQKLPGVFVQAQMVSQILSAVLEERSLLWAWAEWGEICWIWSWSLLGGILAWQMRSPLRLGLAVSGTLIGLFMLCFGLLVQTSCWVPLVPTALALVVTSSSTATYAQFQTRKQKPTLINSENELDRVTLPTP